MKVLIYIELSEEINSQYEKDFIQWVKSTFPDIMTYDSDNHSSQDIISNTTLLIDNATEFTVVINSETTEGTGKLFPMVEKIIKNKEKAKVLLKGHNDVLERMLGIIGEKFKMVYSNDELKVNFLLR